MKKYIFCILFAFAVTACIYPYDAEISGEAPDRLVVSGDILIGDKSRIDLGYVMPLNSNTDLVKKTPPTGTVTVENDQGLQFRGVLSRPGSFIVDTSEAQEDANYRLVIKLTDGREFNTPWSAVNEAPVITDLSYKTDEDNLRIYCSLDGGDSIQNFTWDYEEVWEYHAYFKPDLLYVDGKYEIRIGFSDYYYCWNSRNSLEPTLVSSEALSENRIEENNFLTIPRSDTRISYLYSIKLKASGLTAPAMAYMRNLKTLSDDTGGLFTPTPSEMRGNVSCVTNPDEQVVGYVSVCKRAAKRIFIDATYVYKPPIKPESLLFYPEPDEDGNYDLDGCFMLNSPVSCDDDEPDSTNVKWGPKRCVDCRAWGGTKTKPAWWPNDDE